MAIIPRQKVPALTVPTLDHGAFNIHAASPERMTLVCFYRGLHCPICANYLKELERLTPAFAERGVETIAISSDTEERARLMAEKVGGTALRYGHSLSLSSAREWGLTISTSRGLTSIGIEEPKLFSEPGIFLVKADGSAYYINTQSMPFARPNFQEMVGALDFVIKADYPARGEYTGAV